MDGTWKKDPDDGTLVFTFTDETGEPLSYQAECYWGGLEWTVETVETVECKHSYWFPRLISEVYCDYYNRSFWVNGTLFACCIIIAGNIILAILESRRGKRLLNR